MKKQNKKKTTYTIIGILLTIGLLGYIGKTFDFEDAIDRTQAFFFRTASEKEASTIALDTKIATLTQEIAELQSLREQNEQLRQLLELPVTNTTKKTTAEVVGRDLLLPNAYVLSKGSSSGVFVGDAVVVGEGHLIGKVIKVTATRSVVLLTTDEQSRVTVATTGKVTPIGVTQGQFGLSIVVDLIPQTAQLSEGDILVTSGIESTLLEGLIVGAVHRIVSSDNDLFKKAILRPLVNFDEVRFVSIIHKM